MSAKMNGEGLTFEEWLAAANFGSNGEAYSAAPFSRRAWRAGEDPTDYAAVGPARAARKAKAAATRAEREQRARNAVERLRAIDSP